MSVLVNHGSNSDGKIEQAAHRIDVRTNRTWHIRSFKITLPAQQQGFDYLFPIRVGNGLQRRAALRPDPSTNRWLSSNVCTFCRCCMDSDRFCQPSVA